MNQHQQQQLLSPPQQPVSITNEDIYMRVLAIGDSQQNGELCVNHLEQRISGIEAMLRQMLYNQQQILGLLQQQQQQPLPPLQQEEWYRHPVLYTCFLLVDSSQSHQLNSSGSMMQKRWSTRITSAGTPPPGLVRLLSTRMTAWTRVRRVGASLPTYPFQGVREHSQAILLLRGGKPGWNAGEGR
ncbi:hypothetical protein INT45_013736 [Circinella minor]|uniref:Uncharacterized protein n=1 Tax=Circinella minor TaxID=1195481 RepID=A0A8H7SA10_9FUNG|nr:hypothetical protein INT45_013736 [Circinella minor]